MSQTRLRCNIAGYHSYNSMKQRCLNSKNPAYKHYGGRGIKICKRWAASFDNFLEDMGERPSSSHSLDRIDNDKGYNSKNCRWATKKEQQENKRNSIILNYKGKTLPIKDWAKETGIKFRTLYFRYYSGWNTEDILNGKSFRRGSIKNLSQKEMR